jgi:hypothetical protein
VATGIGLRLSSDCNYFGNVQELYK